MTGRAARERPAPQPSSSYTATSSAAAELGAALERWLLHNSAFFPLAPAALRETRRRLGSGDATPAEHPSGPTWGVYLEDYPPRWRQAWRITRGLLLRFRQEATEHHARFAVVVIGQRFSTDAPPGYFDWDIHWAAPGHALAAEVLARGLVEQGLVPSAR